MKNKIPALIGYNKGRFGFASTFSAQSVPSNMSKRGVTTQQPPNIKARHKSFSRFSAKDDPSSVYARTKSAYSRPKLAPNDFNRSRGGFTRQPRSGNTIYNIGNEVKSKSGQATTTIVTGQRPSSSKINYTHTPDDIPSNLLGQTQESRIDHINNPSNLFSETTNVGTQRQVDKTTIRQINNRLVKPKKHETPIKSRQKEEDLPFSEHIRKSLQKDRSNKNSASNLHNSKANTINPQTNTHTNSQPSIIKNTLNNFQNKDLDHTSQKRAKSANIRKGVTPSEMSRS